MKNFQLLPEGHILTYHEFIQLFHINEDEAPAVIDRFLRYNLIRPLNSPFNKNRVLEISERDTSPRYAKDQPPQKFRVEFVGIVSWKEITLFSYPKFYGDKIPSSHDLRLILSVLENFNSRRENSYEHKPDLPTLNAGLIPTLLFLYFDFTEYGLYTTYQQNVTLNGTGEIDWNRTINNSTPTIVGNSPIYFDYWTRRNDIDSKNFVRRIHAAVVSEASQQLKSLGLLELLQLTEVQPSNESINDIGSVEFLLSTVQRDLATQFNSRNIALLQTIYAFLKGSATVSYDIELRFYCSTSFHVVWEDVCSSVLGNQLRSPLSSISGLAKTWNHYDDGTTLMDLIDRPQWSAIDDIGPFSVSSSSTLIPDIVSIYCGDNDTTLNIFDAKYYCPEISRSRVAKAPGVADVSKQYLYQLAFDDFIKCANITKIHNAFVFPSLSYSRNPEQTVSLNMLSVIGLEPIKYIYVDAIEFFLLYLRSKPLESNRVLDLLNSF